MNTSGLLSEDCISKKLESQFKVYTKDGFIRFVDNLTYFLTPREISELGLDAEILLEIEKHLKTPNDSPTKFKKEISNFNLTNIEEEGSVSNASSDIDTSRDEKDDKDYKEDKEIIDESQTISKPKISLEHSSINKIRNCLILDIPKIDCFQYYLLVASILDEYYYLNQHDIIFEFYCKAIELDKKNFPNIKFYEFIDQFDFSTLKDFLTIANNLKNGDKVSRIVYIMILLFIIIRLSFNIFILDCKDNKV